MKDIKETLSMSNSLYSCFEEYLDIDERKRREKYGLPEDVEDWDETYKAVTKLLRKLNLDSIKMLPSEKRNKGIEIDENGKIALFTNHTGEYNE